MCQVPGIQRPKETENKIKNKNKKNPNLAQDSFKHFKIVNIKNLNT